MVLLHGIETTFQDDSCIRNHPEEHPRTSQKHIEKVYDFIHNGWLYSFAIVDNLVSKNYN